MNTPSSSPQAPAPVVGAAPLIASLNGPGDFDPVFLLGAKASHGSVTLRMLRRPGVEGARVGLIVPKKKTKLAVLRNAFKRVAKEAVRQAVQRGEDLAGCDLVFQFSGLPERDVEAFKSRARAEIEKALAKALSPEAPAPATPTPRRRPSM